VTEIELHPNNAIREDCFFLNHANLPSVPWKVVGSLPDRTLQMGSPWDHADLCTLPSLGHPSAINLSLLSWPLSSTLVLFIVHSILQLMHMTSLSPCLVLHTPHTYDLSHQCSQIYTTALFWADASFLCLAPLVHFVLRESQQQMMRCLTVLSCFLI
jgi:hypothetical protein